MEYTGTGTANKVWLISDSRGSITGHASASGASVATNTYDPYGTPAVNNTGRFQYTGQIWLEEIGLYYYKARYYDPDIRRFITTDPIGYGDGLNMYAYVGGDPMNMRDPSGLSRLRRPKIRDCEPTSTGVTCGTGSSGRGRSIYITINPFGGLGPLGTSGTGLEWAGFGGAAGTIVQMASADGEDRSKVQEKCGDITGLELDNYSKKQFSQYLEVPGDAALAQRVTALAFTFINTPRNRGGALHFGGRVGGERLRGSDQWTALANALEGIPIIARSQMDLTATMNTQFYHADAFFGDPRVPNKGDFVRTPEQYKFWKNLQNGCAFNE